MDPIAMAAQEMLAESQGHISQIFEEEETIEETPQPTDMWQQQRDAISSQEPIRVYGSMPRTSLDMNDLLDRGIRHAYKKALDDSDYLRAQGETQRARIVEQQYMQDWFYPTVDALIRMNSVEDVLNNQDVLAELDGLVIGPSRGSNAGYTSVYVSELYEPMASQTFTSDVEVRRGLRRINELCDRQEIRSAIALATKLQEQIDRGTNRATPEDYQLIQQITLRGA